MAGDEPGSRGVRGLPGKLLPGQVAARADTILAGRVTDIAYCQQGAGDINTLVTISVEENIKGETGAEVVVRVPGGEMGRLTMMVTDNPGFQVGERVVVFLAKGEGIFTVVGGIYGKYIIDTNEMVGDKTLTGFVDRFRDTPAEQ